MIWYECPVCPSTNEITHACTRLPKFGIDLSPVIVKHRLRSSQSRYTKGAFTLDAVLRGTATQRSVRRPAWMHLNSSIVDGFRFSFWYASSIAFGESFAWRFDGVLLNCYLQTYTWCRGQTSNGHWCLSSSSVVVCNAASGRAGRPSGAWAVGRPTVHGGPVRLRPVRATPCTTTTCDVYRLWSDHLAMTCIRVHLFVCIRILF